MYNDFYFDKTCDKALITDNEEYELCKVIADNNLDHGLAPFNKYYMNKVIDFINTEGTDNKFGELTINDVMVFDKSIYFANTFIDVILN